MGNKCCGCLGLESVWVGEGCYVCLYILGSWSDVVWGALGGLAAVWSGLVEVWGVCMKYQSTPLLLLGCKTV